MTVEEEMTIDERFKYLRKMRPRYIKTKRQERRQLLDEGEPIVGLDGLSTSRTTERTASRPAS